MPRLTRHFKKYKKNKTFKRGGSIDNEREGVIDILKNKVSDVASSAFTTVEDAGLKIAGLERINKQEQSSNINNTIDQASTSALNNIPTVLKGLITKVAAQIAIRMVSIRSLFKNNEIQTERARIVRS